MTNALVTIEKTQQFIQKQEQEFNQLAGHGAVVFKREAHFAVQILKNNSYLLGMASKNQDSLKNAIINVAAIGLSLSPVEKLAYLVPRGSAVCLDVSYFGLIKVATESKSIKWAVAELVHENDVFMLKGQGLPPTHEYKPFDSNRGKIIGAYSLAKTFNDEYLTTVMSIDEVYKIRARSEAYKKGMGPWITDEGEMIKKTVIRRGSKFWPKTSTINDRFNHAIAALEESSILDQAHEEKDVTETDDTSALVEEAKNLLVALEREEESYVKHLSRVHRREIKLISDLTKAEIEQSLAELWDLHNKMKEKAETEEKT